MEHASKLGICMTIIYSIPLYLFAVAPRKVKKCRVIDIIIILIILSHGL